MFFKRTFLIAIALCSALYCTGFAEGIDVQQDETVSAQTQESPLEQSAEESEEDGLQQTTEIQEKELQDDEPETAASEEALETSSEELLNQVLESGEFENASRLSKVEIDMVDVLVPIDISFQIDPFEINGQGQIYSDQFGFYNYGHTDVILRIMEYNCIFDNDDEDLILLNESFDWRTESPHKEIYLALKFESHDLPMLIFGDTSSGDAFAVRLKAAEFDADGNFLSLSEGGALLFRMDGNVNPMPQRRWESGEVKTSIVFSLENVDGELQDFDEEDPELEDEEDNESDSDVKDLEPDESSGDRTGLDSPKESESDGEIVIDLPQAEEVVTIDIEVSTDQGGVVSIEVSDKDSEASETSGESG